MASEGVIGRFLHAFFNGRQWALIVGYTVFKIVFLALSYLKLRERYRAFRLGREVQHDIDTIREEWEKKNRRTYQH